jgi:L-fuconolactonase
MATGQETGIIDAHVHIWNRARFHYHWLAPGSLHDRDYSLDDIRPEMEKARVCGGLLIEATNTEAEIDWLLAAAERETNLSWGVIGSIDMEDTGAPARIRRCARNPRFKGVRLNWLAGRCCSQRLRESMLAIQASRLVVDLLADPDYLPSIARFVGLYPSVTFVLNHFGGWDLTADVERWGEAMQPFTAMPNVAVKISGYASLDGGRLRAYLDVADRLFGVERLLFGSNYPFCIDGYKAAVHTVTAVCAGRPDAWRSALLRDTAASIYHLP